MPVSGTAWTRRWGAAIVAGMAALVLAACGAALWYVDGAGERAIATEERAALARELDLFAVIQMEDGDFALQRAIDRRARTQGDRLFALKDADGSMIAGNLQDWPRGLGAEAAWAEVEAPHANFHGQVATRTLGSGLVALVGEDNKAFRDFRKSVSAALWMAIAMVAATCLVLSASVTAFVLRRVRRLSEAAARFSAGEYSVRAPGADGGGPFGEIAVAMNSMLDRIEHLIVGLRTITDSLAHDLRTPLSAVRHSLEQGLLGETVELKQAALETGLMHTDKTLATFSALIDIARAEGGLSRDSMSEADVGQIATDVVELFEPLAAERGIRLKTHFDTVHRSVHKPLLMQGMSNLVHNAIKYAPPGSEVTIDLSLHGASAQFVVADRGPGIPADRRGDAVQRFKHLGGADDEGLGLGLAIVEACARLHGGALALDDNAPGLRARLLF